MKLLTLIFFICSFFLNAQKQEAIDFLKNSGNFKADDSFFIDKNEYIIERKVGAGATSFVYLVHLKDSKSEKKILKLRKPFSERSDYLIEKGFIDEIKESLEDIQSEKDPHSLELQAEDLSRLSQAGLAPQIFYVEKDGDLKGLFSLMEYVPGVTACELLKSEKKAHAVFSLYLGAVLTSL